MLAAEFEAPRNFERSELYCIIGRYVFYQPLGEEVSFHNNAHQHLSCTTLLQLLKCAESAKLLGSVSLSALRNSQYQVSGSYTDGLHSLQR